VDGLAAIEKMLTADALAGWLAKAKGESVYVTLPRFKITQDFRLNDALEALGMTDAFSRKNCNFSGISGNRELFISAVLHKTFVDVNESGTEAAGATAVIMEKKADDGGERPKPAEFKADRPFLFLIHDRETGSIFFLGRVTDPSSK
jgi:serpin B